ncbi:MAG: penicillin acylase family protein [bacterium]|nr:penicillin acylase family protein [bacterium]
MSREIPAERKAVLVRMLRGEVKPDVAAQELSISRRALTDLRRRYLNSKLPQMDGVLKAPLDGPVQVRRDRWGVTHIGANSLADCYVSLGYAMAQDRLWHLDYQRRQAHGRLAEILGPDYLRADRLHRTIGLTRAADEAEISDEAALVLESMTAGINAWMESGRSPLPVEFDLLEYEPEPWTVRDSVVVWKWRWWMLTGRLDNLVLAEAARRHLPPDLFDLFWSVEVGEETIVPGDEPAGTGGYDTGEGSNNWAVGASRSTTGKPILASDPHNPVWHPSQWYQAQLTAPGMDAVGAIFTGTPGIYIGHTRRTAWGVTNHTASIRDLYRETVPQDNPEMYREGEDWRPFEVHQEEIRVKGQAPDLLTVRRTVRGPVVNAVVSAVDGASEPPLSMRWTGAMPFTGIEAMLALQRSSSVADVLEALRQWPCPILNMVFADADGRVGYHAVGYVPRRSTTCYGFRPANDPAHVWDGFYAFDEMPGLVDPEQDWVATANNPPWGGQGPYLSLGSWADGYRFRRIRERIEAAPKHRPEEVGAIHADVVHGRAQDLAGVVARFAQQASNKKLRDFGGLLEGWDGAYATDAVAPTVFTAFWERWLRRVAGMRFPEEVISLVASRAGSVARGVLLGEENGWLPEEKDLETEVLEALKEALGWLCEKVGSRRSQWRWGRLHRVRFAHPISRAGVPEELFDLGPFETSGGTGTVRAAGYSTARPFEVTGLSSYRMVVDMADPARSWAVTTGGQSGHLASSHYGDHTSLWLADEYHPLLMDSAEIEKYLEAELKLEPGE